MDWCNAIYCPHARRLYIGQHRLHVICPVPYGDNYPLVTRGGYDKNPVLRE